jgi:hypothetical protein
MPNPNAVNMKSRTSSKSLSKACSTFVSVRLLHCLDTGGPHKPVFPRKELLENLEN